MVELKNGEGDRTDGLEDVVGDSGAVKVRAGGRAGDGEVCDEVIQIPF